MKTNVARTPLIENRSDSPGVGTEEGLGSDSVESAKAFVGTSEIAKCLTTLKPGYGYMEVSFGPRHATITRVDHRT